MPAPPAVAVAAGAAHERVVAGAAPHDVVALACQRRELRAGAEVAVELVGAGLAVDRVIARLAAQQVAGRAAAQAVVARPRAEDVGAGGPGEDVRAGSPGRGGAARGQRASNGLGGVGNRVHDHGTAVRGRRRHGRAPVRRVGHAVAIGVGRRPAALVSRDGEVAVELARLGVAREHDLAVGLDRDGVGRVAGAAEIRLAVAVGPEAGLVDRAVDAAIARDGEVGLSGRSGDRRPRSCRRRRVRRRRTLRAIR